MIFDLKKAEKRKKKNKTKKAKKNLPLLWADVIVDSKREEKKEKQTRENKPATVVGGCDRWFSTRGLAQGDHVVACLDIFSQN